MLETLKNQVETLEINLPADQFAHTNAPTEWWWHIGTLIADDGRTFGFEVNATGMLTSSASYAFTQIQITDVKNKRNYQKVKSFIPRPNDWAEYDTTKPWSVNLGKGDIDSSVTMEAIDGNPLNMSLQASFIDVNPDSNAQTACQLNLNFFQEGPPLLVWGNGCNLVDPSGTSPITKNNYYYSFTHLKASGSIKIGDEVINVTGLTWMDHEYGAFPNGSTGKVIWLLQDIQLQNGIHLSNYTKFGVYPEENVPMPSNATFLIDGVSTFHKTITTPMGPTYTSKKGITYFLKFKIELEGHSHLSFIVESSCPDQVFRDGEGEDVYEGVGTAKLVYNLTQKKQIVVSEGTAWMEEKLG